MPKDDLKYGQFDPAKGSDRSIYRPEHDYNAKVNKFIGGLLGEKGYAEASEGATAYQKQALDRRQQKTQGKGE